MIPDENEVRECAEIEGYLGEMLTLQLFDHRSVLVAGQRFRLLYAEEAEAVRCACAGTGREVLLARESDGQVFEIEVEVSAWKLAGKTAGERL